MPHATLFLTTRAAFHQQAARVAAPPELALTFLDPNDRPAILAALPEVEFLITERVGVIDGELLRAGRNLKLVQRLGSQTWDIDLEAARSLGLPACCWPSWTCANVAEHLVWQMLALAKRANELQQIATQDWSHGRPGLQPYTSGGENRRAPSATYIETKDWGIKTKRSDENTFAYNWSKRENLRSLRHSTVGILGFGEIGFELVQRLKNFECRMLYHKRHRLPAHVEEENNLAFAVPTELAAQSDFMACLLPYSAETDQSLSAAFFAGMKFGAFFAHCGAGGVVDETALIETLRSGHLAGAALDTFTHEPLPPADPLLALARDPTHNVILTPHIAAGNSAEYRLERAEAFANVLAVLRGEELRYRLV